MQYLLFLAPSGVKMVVNEHRQGKLASLYRAQGDPGTVSSGSQLCRIAGGVPPPDRFPPPACGVKALGRLQKRSASCSTWTASSLPAGRPP